MSKGASLIATGTVLGVVHVLTGPDHLSALATLSANIGSASAAFCLGVRWGVGHSTGLLLVGIVFIALSHKDHHPTTTNDEDTVTVPDRITHIFEVLVGVFMLLLGIYGIHRAYDHRNNKSTSSQASHDHGILPITSPLDASSQQQQQQRRDISNLVVSDDDLQPDTLRHPTADELSYQNHVNVQMGATLNATTSTGTHDGKRVQDIFVEDEQNDDSSNGTCCRWLHICVSRISPRTLSLLTGILHGLAGPGGVLAIIPAVQLRNAKLATIYLGTFCVVSTVTMGVFATIYGSCSSRLAGATSPIGGIPSRRVFQIECGSACLSLVVGILWLILLGTGNMDKVFPE